MTVRLTARQPERGPGFEAPSDAEGEPPPDVSFDVEEGWDGLALKHDPPESVVIVDGTRRIEALGMDRDVDGVTAALWGASAVGAVLCSPGATRILDERLDVRRYYFYTKASAEPFPVPAGGVTLAYAPQHVEPAGPNALYGALQSAMLHAETRLAASLTDEHPLVMIDGSLHQHSLDAFAGGGRVVGYTKSIHQWYVGPDIVEQLVTIPVGQRSAVFTIESKRTGWRRYSWFVPLARMPRHIDQLSGLARLEVSASVGEDEAKRIADETAQVLPRLASPLGNDPRAPQNLVPVGALEAEINHALGDVDWIYRQIEAEVSRREREEASV